MQENKVPVQVIRLSVIAVVIIAIIVFKTITSNIVEAKVDKLLEATPKGVITYESASMDIIGLEVCINDVTIKAANGKSIKIDEIVINDIDTDNDIPQYMDIEINDIEGDLETLKLDRNSAKLIDMLELKELVSDIAFKYSFDKEENILEIDDVSFKVEDLGKLAFEVELHGVQSLSGLGMQMMMAPQNLKIASASIEYDNYADKELISAMVAVSNGLSYDESKAKSLQKLSRTIEELKDEDDDIASELAEMIHDFYEDPKSFEISISPENAVSIRKITGTQSAKEAKELLNFKVEVN